MMYAKVIQSGNSAVITLPKRYREQNGVEIGDRVSIGFPTSSMMTIEPIPSSRTNKYKAFLELREHVKKETEGTSFPSTKEEVRAMLADRDA